MRLRLCDQCAARRSGAQFFGVKQPGGVDQSLDPVDVPDGTGVGRGGHHRVGPEGGRNGPVAVNRLVATGGFDRLSTGSQGLVIDFFDFRIWPVFNVADIAIVLGVAGMIFAILFRMNERE